MKTAQLQNQVGLEKGEFELIKGTFSPDDAWDILSDLIQRKINYHSLRSLSHYEQFGTGDQWSERRITELKKSFDTIQAMVNKAKARGGSLEVRSGITVEMVTS